MKQSLFKNIFILCLASSVLLPVYANDEKNIQQAQNDKEVSKVIEQNKNTKKVSQQAPKIEIKQEKPIISAGVEKSTFLSVDDCLNLALENNPTIKAAVSQTYINKSKIGQVWSNYLPEVNLSGGTSRVNPANALSSFPDVTRGDVTASASVGITLFDFGKTPIEAKIKKLMYLASTEDLKTTIQTIVYNVKSNYYNLLYAFDSQKTMEESVSMYMNQKEQANALYEVGLKPKIDVMAADTNFNTAKLYLIKAINNVEIAKASLNNSMGLTTCPEFELKDTLVYNKYQNDFNKIIEMAYKNRPELKSIMHQEQALKKSVTLAKITSLPDVKGNVGYSLAGQHFKNTDDGFNIGASVSIPVFNIYKTKKIVDEANATYDMNLAQMESVKQNIYLEVKQSHANLVEAEQKIPVSKVALNQAKENYNLAKGRYKAGVGNHIELKDAEVTLRSAKLEYFASLRDYNVAVSSLEKSIGHNLEEEKI